MGRHAAAIPRTHDGHQIVLHRQISGDQCQFKKFLDATHYRPKDNLNFLRDWKNGTYPDGWDNKPVTWVSSKTRAPMRTGRASGYRMNGSGSLRRRGQTVARYPWGNEWNASAVPVPDHGKNPARPGRRGRSSARSESIWSYGPRGNVWQWTDEYVDEHTRAGILRGGNYYQPQGSIWYFPEAYRNDQHGKLLLMSPSYDRSGTLGFRCAMDAEQ